jgi:hypothetical protein
MVTAPEWVARFPARIRRRRGAIPLSDAVALRIALRRTTLVRFVLAGLLVALAVLAVWRAARLNPRAVAFLPEHSTTVVVVDQSKSVYISSYRRIAAVLRKLVQADVPIGLVAFSDTAYEMMPPGARGSELKPLLRFYAPSRAVTNNVDPSTLFATTPWQNVFSGGTKISSGLDLARSMLHRDHVRNGTILLLSDLETAGEDQPNLAQSLIRTEHDADVTLKVIPLFPNEADLRFFGQFVPPSALVKPEQLRVKGAAEPRHTLIALVPWPLLIAVGLLLVALAVNELTCGRLHLPRPREASA